MIFPSLLPQRGMLSIAGLLPFYGGKVYWGNFSYLICLVYKVCIFIYLSPVSSNPVY